MKINDLIDIRDDMTVKVLMRTYCKHSEVISNTKQSKNNLN